MAVMTSTGSNLRSRLYISHATRPVMIRHRFVDDVIKRDTSKFIAIRSKPRATYRSATVLSTKSKKKAVLKRLMLTAVAIVVIAAGSIISWEGWRANQIAEAQAAQLTRDANYISKLLKRPATVAKAAAANPAPATTTPTANDLAAYTVAPTLPRYLIIPKIGVDARVLQLGLTSSGAVATPPNVFDTGWYTGSAKPGDQGATLIDGHISSWTTNGVFYNLKKLNPGDQMQIVRGDNVKITYEVVKTQTYSDNNTDMTSALTPVVAGTPGLNLISCYGKVKPGTSEFDQRIVVYTKQVAQS